MNNCEYCKKSFSTKSNLINHQKTAKVCLNKRKIINEEYKCGCEKIFTTKINFERHRQICNIYFIIQPYKEKNIKLENENKLYLEELEKKDNHIRELEKELASIARAAATRPTTNNITNINNKIINISPLDLRLDKIKNILDEKYDHNYIVDGQKGLAQFINEHLLKDDDGKSTYICTDTSRQIFKYKDTLGDIQKDVKAKKLTQTLIDGGLKDKNHKISVSYWSNQDGSIDNDRYNLLVPKATEINTISITENTLFVNELSAITSL